MLDISAQSAIISTVLKSEDSAGSEKAFNGAELSDGICESAGTGRQARLRGVCQPTWEFKSPLSHQKSRMRKRSGFSFFHCSRFIKSVYFGFLGSKK